MNKDGVLELRLLGKTYQGIADIVGVSRQRIHQIATGWKGSWRKTRRGRTRLALNSRDFYAKRKALLLTHYGNDKLACVKCGFSDIRALSIDHINGGGGKQRAALPGYAFYNWLIKNDYPGGYQTLCMNCQWVKRTENKELRRQKKNT